MTLAPDENEAAQSSNFWEDPRTHMALETRLSLSRLAEEIGGRLLDGRHADVEVKGVSGLREVEEGHVTFVESAQLLSEALDSPCAALIVPTSLECNRKPAIAVRNPKLAFARLLALFHPRRLPEPGLHPTAVLSSSARVAASACVGPYCVIEDGAEISGGAHLLAHVRIGRGSRVEANAVLHPHVTLGKGVQVGRDCILHGGTRLGDRVQLGESVEIGANSVVGAEARVLPGTKCDNHVLISPRATIGRACILVAQCSVGIGATLADGVVIAAQACVPDGVSLVSGVVLGGRCVPGGDVTTPGYMSGHPARPHREELRAQATLQRMGEILPRVLRLESKLDI